MGEAVGAVRPETVKVIEEDVNVPSTLSVCEEGLEQVAENPTKEIQVREEMEKELAIETMI